MVVVRGLCFIHEVFNVSSTFYCLLLYFYFISSFNQCETSWQLDVAITLNN